MNNNNDKKSLKKFLEPIFTYIQKKKINTET